MIFWGAHFIFYCNFSSFFLSLVRRHYFFVFIFFVRFQCLKYLFFFLSLSFTLRLLRIIADAATDAFSDRRMVDEPKSLGGLGGRGYSLSVKSQPRRKTMRHPSSPASFFGREERGGVWRGSSGISISILMRHVNDLWDLATGLQLRMPSSPFSLKADLEIIAAASPPTKVSFFVKKKKISPSIKVFVLGFS